MFSSPFYNSLPHTIPSFNDLGKETFGKHCGKKEKMLVTSSSIFLLFPQCFVLHQGQILSLKSLVSCRLQKLSIWSSLKHLSFGKELRLFIMSRDCFETSWSSISDNLFFHGHFSERLFENMVEKGHLNERFFFFLVRTQ